MRIAALLLCTLLLVGCYANDTSIFVNSNGSGRVEITAGINKTYEAQAEASGSIDPANSGPMQIRSALEATVQNLDPSWNPKVEAWEDQTFSGARLTLSFSSIDQLRDQLTQIVTTYNDSGYNQYLSAVNVDQQNKQITIVATVVERSSVPDTGEIADADKGRVGFAVALPVLDNASQNSYATVSGNTVIWSMPFEELNEGRTNLLQAAGRMDASAPIPPTTTVPTASPTATFVSTGTPTSLPSTATVRPTTMVPASTTASTAVATIGATAVNTAVPTPRSETISSTAIVPTQTSVATVAVENSLPKASPTRASIASAATAAPFATFLPSAAAQLAPTSVAATSNADQVYVPLAGAQAGGISTAHLPNAKAGATATTEQPIWIVYVLLGCSVACFGYVIYRRVLRRRALERASALPSYEEPVEPER